MGLAARRTKRNRKGEGIIACPLHEEKRLLHMHPIIPIQKSDFDELKRKVDPFVENEGKLNGLVIKAEDFSGWES